MRNKSLIIAGGLSAIALYAYHSGRAELVVDAVKGAVMPAKFKWAPVTTDQRNANASLIIATFTSEFPGYGSKIGKAAAVNAYHESGLNPLAIGDGGKSIGLFQLHENGAGKEKAIPWVTSNSWGALQLGPDPRDPRFDKVKNIAEIIKECKRKYGNELRAKALAGASVWELTYIFCRDIERPLDPLGVKRASRAATAKIWYPGE